MPGLLAEPRRATGLLGEWRAEPLVYSRSVLRSDPWSGAARMLRAIAVPHARVCVRGAHATAKSRTAAEIVLWALACGYKVVTTAARYEQVRKNLWGEVRGLIRCMIPPLGVEANQTEIQVSPDCWAVGWSTDEETRFQGVHGPRVLFVVDEAAGVADGIFRAIDGARAGGDVRELHLGNPSAPRGAFYESSRSAAWMSIRLDAFDTPSLRGVSCEAAGVTGPGRVRELESIPEVEVDVVQRPYLAGPRWAREMLATYGASSAVWRWKVRGEFPQQAADALILLEWIEAQRHREARCDETEQVEVGIDVAGPGEDEHVLCARRGPTCVLQPTPLDGSTPDALADSTLRVLRAMAPRPGIVRYDSCGIGGYFGRILSDAGFAVEGVNVAEGCPTDRERERYANVKARNYWLLRERFAEGRVAGVSDDVTLHQLGELRWSEPKGRVQIERKDEMRNRGLRSPDRAEALMLAYAPAARARPPAFAACASLA